MLCEHGKLQTHSARGSLLTLSGVFVFFFHFSADLPFLTSLIIYEHNNVLRMCQILVYCTTLRFYSWCPSLYIKGKPADGKICFYWTGELAVNKCSILWVYP